MDTQQESLLCQLRAKARRYQLIIVALIVLILGGLLLFFKNLFPDPEIARDLAIALITAATVGLAVEFYVRKEFESLIVDRLASAINASDLPVLLNLIQDHLSLGRNLSALGLRKAHTGRPMNELDSFIRSADPNTEIRLLGICLLSFSNAIMQGLFVEKLTQGCTIRMLTLAVESPHVDQRAIEEYRTSEDLRADIKAADAIHRSFISNRVPTELRSHIDLSYYDAYPSCFLLSTNKGMIVGSYLLGARGERFPHLELDIKGGGIHEAFIKHFDLLKESKQCS